MAETSLGSDHYKFNVTSAGIRISYCTPVSSLKVISIFLESMCPGPVWSIINASCFNSEYFGICSSPNRSRTEGVLTDLVENWWSHATAVSPGVASQNLVKHNVFGTGD